MYGASTDELIDLYFRSLEEQLDAMEEFFFKTPYIPGGVFKKIEGPLPLAHQRMVVAILKEYRTLKSVNAELESRGMSQKCMCFCYTKQMIEV